MIQQRRAGRSARVEKIVTQALSRARWHVPVVPGVRVNVHVTVELDQRNPAASARDAVLADRILANLRRLLEAVAG